MTAAARNTRKNNKIARNAARKSIPRNTSPTHSSITRSPSPSLTALDSSTLNRAKHDSATRSARATAAHAAHAARRESERAIFGRPATATEGGYLRHLKSHIKNTLAPACKVECLEIRDVFNRAIEQLKRH